MFSGTNRVAGDSDEFSFDAVNCEVRDENTDEAVKSAARCRARNDEANANGVRILWLSSLAKTCRASGRQQTGNLKPKGRAGEGDCKA